MPLQLSRVQNYNINDPPVSRFALWSVARVFGAQTVLRSRHQSHIVACKAAKRTRQRCRTRTRSPVVGSGLRLDQLDWQESQREVVLRPKEKREKHRGAAALTGRRLVDAHTRTITRSGDV